jgi:hypothetical protein
MLSRPAVLRSLKCSRFLTPFAYNSSRCLASKTAVKKVTTPKLKDSEETSASSSHLSSSVTPSSSSSDQTRPKSWLTHQVETSPIARYWFDKVTTLLGYNSPKQLAGRRAFVLYKEVCAPVPDADQTFWQNSECLCLSETRRVRVPSSHKFGPFRANAFLFAFALYRMRPSSNVSVLVHNNQFTHMDAHGASPRAP